MRTVQGPGQPGQARGAPFGPRPEARDPAQRLSAPLPTLGAWGWKCAAVRTMSPPLHAAPSGWAGARSVSRAEGANAEIEQQDLRAGFDSDL